MDNMEPWKMFTSDFLADVNENSLENVDISSDNMGFYDAGTLERDQPVKNHAKSNENDTSKDNGGGDDARDGTVDDDMLFNFDVAQQDDDAAGMSGASNQHSTFKKETSSTFPSFSDDTPVRYERYIIYICPACGAEFTQQSSWKRHLNATHNFNTREGLNFIPLDKLYHECLECFKRIAMHSMENLLKHKFTHLPFRCTKCSVCQREYKYRQDLMVHLRVSHQEHYAKVEGSLSRDKPEITDVKENAMDLFDNSLEDGIEVKNELIEPDDHDFESNSLNELSLNSGSLTMTSFVGVTAEGSASQEATDHRRPGERGEVGSEDQLYEQNILYICPQCGKKYDSQSEWRKHMDIVHDFASHRGLNFKEINKKQNSKCLECNKVIVPNSITDMQQHKFSHLLHKPYRCLLCLRTCARRKDILKHLRNQHRLTQEPDEGDEEKGEIAIAVAAAADDSNDGRRLIDNDEDDDAVDEGNSNLLSERTSSRRSLSRDVYERYIYYLCPECGKEFHERKLWRKHIVKAHRLTDLQVLKFKVLNDRQVMCLECDKVITNAYGVQNAQQHRITHMPYKSFIRCRLCIKTYTDRKGAVKHLRSKHRIGRDFAAVAKVAAASVTAAMAAKRQASAGAQQRHKQQSSKREVLSESPKGHKVMKSRRKEVIRYNGVVYEIRFLDEKDNEDDAGSTKSEDEKQAMSAASSRPRCADCNVSFDSAAELRHHFNIAHNNVHNYRQFQQQQQHHYQSMKSSIPAAGESFTDDSNDLLVPARSFDAAAHSDTAQVTLESNYCFLCPSCGLECKTKRLWRTHLNEEHNFDKRPYLSVKPIDRYRYQCTICKEIVSGSTMSSLQTHKFRHLPYRLYIKCLICGVCYNHTPNMEKHLRMKHNINAKKQSQLGNNSFSSSSNISRSNVNTISNGQSGSGGVNRSKSSHSIVRPPPTTRAGGHKSANYSLQSQLNAVEHESIVYYCPQCNNSFGNHGDWRTHIVEQHQLNSLTGLNFRKIDDHHYLCLQCYKWVTVTHTKGAISQLQSHKFRHLRYRSFRCLQCQSEFVRKQMFFRHLNKATNKCDSIAHTADTDKAATAINNAVAGAGARMSRLSDQFEDNNAVIDPDAEGLMEDSESRQSAGAKSLVNGGNGQRSSDSDTRPKSSNSLSMTQQRHAMFVLICPQCGEQFDTQLRWRDHINVQHDLGKREELRFKRLGVRLHQCLDCNVRVIGKKLRDLQIHRFKHLPYGSAYIQCSLCKQAYNHLGNMQDHLKTRHKRWQHREDYDLIEELRQYEAISLTDGSDVEEDDEQMVTGADADADQDNNDDNDNDDVDDDDQYLLG